MAVADAAHAAQSEALMQGKNLAARAKREMLRPQIQIHSKAQFPTLSTETTTANRALKLAYGIGWGLFETPYGKAYFKEGHDDGWENHWVVFDDKKISLVLMANSSNGDSIFKELATLIKDSFTPWEWEGYAPYDQGRRGRSCSKRLSNRLPICQIRTMIPPFQRSFSSISGSDEKVRLLFLPQSGS